MSEIEQSKHRRMAFWVCVLFFIAWVNLLSFKFYHFGYYDWDLAFFTQACWKLIHGSQFVSLVGINYFGDHSYFITFFILPFFALFPHPLTLIVFKVGAFFISAFLLYRIFLRGLGPTVAMGLMLGYILFPANMFALLYEYNPESLAVPFIVLMFDLFERRRWKGFWTSVFFLVLVKENLALLSAAFGIYAWITARDDEQKKHAQWVLALSLLVFWFFVFILIPHFRNLATHPFIVRYNYLGSSPQDILLNIIQHPLKFISKYLLSPRHVPYLLQLFGFWILPCLYGFAQLLVCLPILLQHLLSASPQEHTIVCHYGMTMAPIIFLSVYHGLIIIKSKFSQKIFLMLVSLLFLMAFYDLKFYVNDLWVRVNAYSDVITAKRWEFVQCIPSQAGVVSTFEFLAPLSLRSNLYSFHKVYDKYFQDPDYIKQSELNVQKTFTLPINVSYALIDFKDHWLVSNLESDPGSTNLRVKQFLSQWKLIKQVGSICLFIRK